MTPIIARTAKGKAALAGPSAALPRKQRILLMAIDDRTPRQMYLNSLKSFGDVSALLDELEQAGLITSHAASAQAEPVQPEVAVLDEPAPLAPSRTRADFTPVRQQPFFQTMAADVDRLSRALNLMCDFVTEQFPEQAFEMLIELEKLDTLNDLLAVLPDYQMAVSRKPLAALPHLSRLNAILAQ